MADKNFSIPSLVASDVDGTLLDHHDRLTDRTKAAVHAVIASGATFVLSTGRPPRWIAPVVDQLGYAPMSVCANGAVIYDASTDTILDTQALSVDILGVLAETAARVLDGCGMAVERVGRSAHDSATPQFVSAPGYEHAWLNPDHVEMSALDMLSAPAVKMLIRCSDMSSGAMADALEPHVSSLADITFSTDNGLIELAAPGVSKASGLLIVARRLGIDPSSIVAFGDMPNDIPMLQMVGHGVAMANAHPATVAAADEVTLSNADDGVAHVLERWFPLT